MFNGGCNMAEDFGGIIVLAVIATIIALVLGAIALLLNFNWLSFLVGVALVGIGIGVLSGDIITAAISGAITGLLVAILKGVVISIFWGTFASNMFGSMYGGQFLILIFIGALFAGGSSLLLSN